MDIEIVEVPIVTSSLFLEVVVYSPSSGPVCLREAINDEQKQFKGWIVSPRRNIVAFLRRNELNYSTAKSTDSTEILFSVPAGLRSHRDAIFVECSEGSALNKNVDGDEHELIGSARVVCDVLGRPLSAAILPFNTSGGRTAIFQIVVGEPFIIIQTLLFRSGERVALIETFVSSYTCSGAFVSIRGCRTDYVYDQLEHVNRHLGGAFEASVRRCCVPVPQKPAYAQCV
ncbi:MAG: hypothetical protein IT292_04975 [Deltaproteobacteria bacterium]|nr:hypothetical protein [Deltaproteobacteria bacterium]